MHTPRTFWSSAILFCALSLALGAEAASLVFLASEQLMNALALHTVAALSCALAGSRAALLASETRPEFAALVSGSLVLSLPGLGFLGVTWVVLPHLAAPRRAANDNVLELELPSFHRHDTVAFDLDRGFARIEDELSPERPVEQRVRSVMSLRRMDPKRAVPLLRIALGDQSEDVRLLAYAILERREKQIRVRINRALGELRDAAEEPQADGAQLARMRGLANDHWELVYGEFSEGDGHKLNLEQAAHWAEQVLATQFDATTALLLARVRLKQLQPEAAWQLIMAARSAGVATDVCAPLLAEAAFLMRNFDAVPRLLAQVADDSTQTARLEPVTRFWTAQDVS